MDSTKRQVLNQRKGGAADMSSKDPVEIWSRPEQSAAGRQPEHSRASIVQGALALADEGGLGAVSIRKVAAGIGAGAASLYRYVKSHDELIELMIDAISGEYRLDPEPGSVGQTPGGRLLGLALQGREIMKRHPWSAPLLLSDPALGPNSLAYLDHALSIMAATTLGAAAKLRTVAMLTAVTSAFVQNELATTDVPGRSARDVTMRAGYLGQAAASGKYPALASVLGEGPQPEQPDEVFTQIIATYLAGAGLPVDPEREV